MSALPSIPIEMRDELLAGVDYIKTIANRFQKLELVVVDLFGEKLAEKLCQKYSGHWYPEKPTKGQTYRCIRINRYGRDERILEVCAHSGLKYHELALPKEMTLWIDPYEICRLGEESYPYTVASFDPKITCAPDASSKLLVEHQLLSLSLPSSPSLNGEDIDSGMDAICDGTTTPMSCSLTEEQIWQTPAAEEASQTVFRTSSPLWIPAWRFPQFYHNLKTDLQHVYWL